MQNNTEIPEARDATWDEWVEAVMWNQTTIPGILLEEQETQPVPIDLLLG